MAFFRRIYNLVKGDVPTDGDVPTPVRQKFKNKNKNKERKVAVRGTQNSLPLPSCCVYLIKKGGLKNFLFQIKIFGALPS